MFASLSTPRPAAFAGCVLALLLWAGCGPLDSPPRRADPRQPTDADVYAGAIGTPTIDLTGWATAIESHGVVRGVPKRIRRIADSAEMVLVPSGRFLMGNPKWEDPETYHEGEQHSVTITRWYYMDVNEVTVGQFRSFVDATSYRTDAEQGGSGVIVVVEHGPGGLPIADRQDWRATLRGEAALDQSRLPVIYVSWQDAVAYAKWARAALPTEAEFERAIRGLREGEEYPWPGTGLDFTLVANTQGERDGFAARSPVRSFPPNVYGLYDVEGNVGEYCADESDHPMRQFSAEPVIDPVGRVASGRSANRIVRGGDWMVIGSVQCSSRRSIGERWAEATVGFRLTRRCDSK